MNNKIKVYVSIIIIILITMVLVMVFAFAYFTADVTKNKNILLNTTISDSYMPAFETDVDKNLSINVPDEAMYEEVAGTVAGYDTSNITTTITGGSSANPYTCSFDFVWKDTDSSTAYTYLLSDQNLLEYSISIDNTTTSTNVVSEKNMKDVSNGSTIASLSITSDTAILVYNYKVTVKLYNLDVPQTIYGKTFSGRVTEENIVCGVD